MFSGRSTSYSIRCVGGAGGSAIDAFVVGWLGYFFVLSFGSIFRFLVMAVGSLIAKRSQRGRLIEYNANLRIFPPSHVTRLLHVIGFDH